ncbi:hypothetical protein [Rhizobium yanglingense]
MKRKWLREAELQRQQIEQAIDVLAQGVIDADEKEKLAVRTEESFSRVKRALRNPVFETAEIEQHGLTVDTLRAKYDAS